MSPNETERLIDDWVLTATNDGDFYKETESSRNRNDYTDFASHCHRYCDKLMRSLHVNNRPSLPKRRFAVAMWEHYNRSRSDSVFRNHREVVNQADGIESVTAQPVKKAPKRDPEVLITEWVRAIADNPRWCDGGGPFSIKADEFRNFCHYAHPFIEALQRNVPMEDQPGYPVIKTTIALWKFYGGSRDNEHFQATCRCARMPFKEPSKITGLKADSFSFDEFSSLTKDNTMNDTAKSAISGMNSLACSASSTIPVQTITYVYGQDVTKMTDDQLIGAIKVVEGQIAELTSVKTASKKIAAKVAAHEVTLSALVDLLDARV